MFKPNYNICIECNQKRLIVVKKGLCKKCNDSKKTKAKPIKTVKIKKTGELDLFKEIWHERPHICQVTNRLISNFDIRCFSHIVPKSLRNDLRLSKENIWIVLPEIHNLWEFGSRELPIFEKKKKEFDRLRHKN